MSTEAMSALSSKALLSYLGCFLQRVPLFDDDQIAEFIQSDSWNAIFVIERDNDESVCAIELDDTLDLDGASKLWVVMKPEMPLTDPGQLIVTGLPLQDYSGNLDTVKALVSRTVSNYFDAITRQARGDPSSIGLAKKRINELVLSLEHLKQNVRIPNLLITVYPAVQSGGQEAIDIEDSTALNEIQSIAADWLKQIQNVVDASHTLQNGSALEEVEFWSSKEKALEAIEKQLEEPGVVESLAVLRKAKRFHAGITFLNGTSIHDALSVSVKYNQLLGGLPVRDLLASDDLPAVKRATSEIFHSLKKLKVTQYPLDRAILLGSAIARDVNDKVYQITTKNLKVMHMPFDEYQQAAGLAEQVYAVLDSCITDFTLLVREQLRKKSAAFMVVKVGYPKDLKDRLAELSKLRTDHEEFVRSTARISKLLSLDPGYLDVSGAYRSFGSIDCLDLSQSGSKKFHAAASLYDQRIGLIEQMMASKLRESLDGALTDPNRMISLFEAFGFILSRADIRSAVEDYQEGLVKTLQGDLKLLQRQFEIQQCSRTVLRLRHIPPYASAVVWIQQLTEGLRSLIRRLEYVLSENWRQYPEGKQMSVQIEAISENLDASDPIKLWQEKAIQMLRSSLLDQMILIRDDKGGYTVNFGPVAFGLATEVDSMRLLGFEISKSLVQSATQLERVHPLASALTEVLYNFQQVSTHSGDLGELDVLLNPLLQGPQELLDRLATVSWNDLLRGRDLVKSGVTNTKEVQALEDITSLEDKVADLMKHYDSLQDARTVLVEMLPKFSVLPYTKEAIANQIEELQSLLNSLSSSGFLDLGILSSTLNSILKHVLLERAQSELAAISDELSVDTHVSQRLPACEHQVVFEHGSITASPPLEDTKANWIDFLNDCVDVVASQKQLSGSSFKVVVDEGTAKRDDFQGLALDLNADYNCVLLKITDLLHQVSDYVGTWQKLQSLWDLTFDDVRPSLGPSLGPWLKSMGELQRIRELVDTVTTTKMFGPLELSYIQVQSRVSSQLDKWQRNIAGDLASILQEEMNKTLTHLSEQQDRLDHLEIDPSSSYIVDACSFLFQTDLDIKRILFDDYKQGSVLLTHIRFHFPTDWTSYERLDGQRHINLELLRDSLSVIMSQLPLVEAKVKEEAFLLHTSISRARKDWRLGMSSGSTEISVEEAVKKLARFDKLFSSLRARGAALEDSISLLELEDVEIEYDEALSDAESQLEGLKEVWGCISTLTAEATKFRSISWEEFVPRKSLKLLDAALATSRTMPIKARRSPAFNNVQSGIKDCIKMIPVLSLLKNDAITPLHWKSIFEALHVRHPSGALTVGDVIDLQPKVHEKYIKSVVQRAQAEKVLTDSLSDLENSWNNRTFELQDYDDGYFIVTGWSALLDQLDSDLNTLVAVKLSPLAVSFKDRVDRLETRLSTLRDVLTVWVDVQRDWVYLYGIFRGNENIRSLLPIEAGRFDNVTSELFLIFNAAYKLRSIADVISIEGINSALHRVTDVLSKTKKSLIGYLEAQRERFARFYFVGNDDLLEIIGNTDDIVIASKHIGKMFPGIGTLRGEGSMITGVESSDGDLFMLHEPIDVSTHVIATEWLAQLDSILKESLYRRIEPSLSELEAVLSSKQRLVDWVDSEPNQILTLSLQLKWTSQVESHTSGDLTELQETFERFLSQLKSLVLESLTPVQRIKIENLMVETLHKQYVLRMLSTISDLDLTSYEWIIQQRSYCSPDTHSVVVKQGVSSLEYGFEFLGSSRSLVHTQLTNNVFLSMTEAINQHVGSSLVGPSGTGKTESVKALGNSCGRLVSVFCCDETFDYYSVSRIMAGLCRLGSWGCFDEFNRLDKGTLSAISTQIEKIEGSLDAEDSTISLLGKDIRVARDTGIFITSNPDYSGRSPLPDNLKSKYRTFSVVKPDTVDITESLLTSQGFVEASDLARIFASMFIQLSDECSDQLHYDFGLRALKSTLLRCGQLKRKLPQGTSERSVLATGFNNIVLPRLVSEDEAIFSRVSSVLGDPVRVGTGELESSLQQSAAEHGLQASPAWLRKAVQLNEVSKSHQGYIMVGNSGSGKSCMLKCLLETLPGENVSYVIDPKVVSKDQLFGSLDYSTREWKEGIFTDILRNVGHQKDAWVIFDGDIDPEWVENLNSVLDDSKLLTLPTGERLAVPSNLHIVFEVDSLASATPATISRCGAIWFGDSLYDTQGMIDSLMHEFMESSTVGRDKADVILLPAGLNVDDLKKSFSSTITKLVTPALLNRLVELVDTGHHVMKFSTRRSLATFFTLLSSSFDKYLSFICDNVGLSHKNYDAALTRVVAVCAVWAFGGDLPLVEREQFASNLLQVPPFTSLNVHDSLLYEEPTFDETCWSSYRGKVPSVSLDPQSVVEADTVVPTLDTIRTEELMFSLLKKHRNLILSGPPGAGKTMLLMSALRRSHDFEFVGLNFSQDTTQDLIIKTLEQHCVYRNGPTGLVLQPSSPTKWLVLFCDEMNLPKPDKYGTQPVISIMRQISTQHGFWSNPKKGWVTLSRVQFVGACNPPSDPGRNSISSRLLRVSDVLMVDYPGRESLSQIYLAFCTAMLKVTPDLRVYSECVASAMLEFYDLFRAKFDRSAKSYYITSPRELTRWTRGMYKGLKEAPAGIRREGLIRLWAAEAIRLFSDRLNGREDKHWVLSTLKSVAIKCFPHADTSKALSLPILYTDWLSYYYEPVDEKQLSDFVDQRLRVFSEEETNASIILHEDMLLHILKIDRVLKTAQGHAILVGPSGSGKTTLTRFVAWMNGVTCFKLSVSKSYTLDDFDETLKDLLLRSGTRGEKICLVIDESTLLTSSFLERMNTLLANSEIPGLFEGEEMVHLLDAASQGSQENGLYLSSDEELYQWFTQQVALHFHVVFTITNPEAAYAPQIISSPALFNRCVLDWMGEWSRPSLVTVATKSLQSLPLDRSDYEGGSYRSAVINALLSIYGSVGNPEVTRSPLHLVTLVRNFESLYIKQEGQLRDYYAHVQLGLDRLREAFLNVKELQKSLQESNSQLESKDHEARVTLDKMLTEQNEAERKEEASIEIQKLLRGQDRQIQQRRDIVLSELSEVQPLIQEARKAVKSISKQNLTEMRSMNNPPEAIKLTLESVCVLLGYDVHTWRDVQSAIRKEDFISSVINFKGEKVTRQMTRYMAEHYLSNSLYNYESANRASKACGPLLLWVEAQLKYATIVDKVEPLRTEMIEVEDSALETKNKLLAINGMVTDLRRSIEESKQQYSQLIRDTENLKMQMADVQRKVSYSTKLLESLGDEKLRWQASIGEFEARSDHLVGNVILCSAFMTFAGPCDEQLRSTLWSQWKAKLDALDIDYDPVLTFTGWMADYSELLRWENNGLPSDDLFLQNITIMNSVDRHPFIIDPSGCVAEFLEKDVDGLKVTSFLDEGYVRQLEDCVRFGGSILLLDGEHYDPIINNLVSQETETSGGQSLVTIGDKKLVLSPSFKMCIHTRDPAIRVRPFIASRMSVLNFTFTDSSTRRMASNMVLQSQRPELDAQRLEMLKSNGEYKEKLLASENELLKCLSSSKNSLLENEELINQLQDLKDNSKLIKSKIASSTQLMEETERAIASYDSIASLYCSFSHLLEHMSRLNPIYEFSGEFVNKVLATVLARNKTRGEDALLEQFALLFYSSVCVSLLHKDRPLLGVLSYSLYSAAKIGLSDFTECSKERDDDNCSAMLNAINRISGDAPVPTLPDVSITNFADVVEESSLLLLRCSEGVDPMLQIGSLAKQSGKKLLNYSVGSNESIEDTAGILREASKNGEWVVVENIQMSSELAVLVPKFFDTHTGNGSKVFLTCPLMAQINSVLCRMSRQVVFEQGPGIKHIMEDQLGGFTSGPFGRIHFLLVWIYAVLRERLRFVPEGMAKNYEFNEYDLAFAHTFVQEVSKTVSSIETVPWQLLVKFVGEIVFGGKVDVQKDADFMKHLCSAKLTLQTAEGESSLLLCDGPATLAVPEEGNEAKWVEDLPDVEPCDWIGLPTGADDELKRKQAKRTTVLSHDLFDKVMGE